MDDELRAPGSGNRSRARARKPTITERRERRAAVEDVAEVMDAAARFLEARPRSESEVRRKLSTMGYRAELVDEVVGRLLVLGYLDDAAFARAWVESRDRARPRGEHALRRELQLKGVDRTLVDGILGDRRDEARDEAAAAGDAEPANPDDAAAERLLRRKLPALLREPDLRKRRQRAYATLARSGFGPDVCSAVSRRVLDEAPGDDGGDGEDGAGADPDALSEP
jgi:regulatory protein